MSARRDRRKTDEVDALKDWLVQWLAEHVKIITKGRGAADFWATLERGVGLELAVAKAYAERVEVYKGSIISVAD